jgi:2-polyprenyl-6-methoxyphenol hydroxylase-like FAD-dependent oxidoreductase
MQSQNAVSKTQVIIVGAGPTGLSMATQLLRHNIGFIILEKNKKTTLLSKAVVVQARTLEIFEEIGLAGKAIDEGRITTALNLFYKGKRKAAINLSGLGEGLSQFPYVLSLEQSKTEKLLAGYLSENHANIQWQSEFSHSVQDDKGVTVYYKDANGKELVLEAEYLIGCDGAGSLVRHQMGLLFKGDTVPKIFYVADVKLKSNVINKNELFIFLIQKGFILFFPMEGENHYRIVGILPEAETTDRELLFSDIENTIKQQVEVALDFEELRWFSSYKVHSRKADRFMDRRYFIAGDAAHIHTPAGGQGMNTGIQDAYNLAWKLAYVLKGMMHPDILKTYNTERQENAKHLLRTTDRMFDIMAGTNGFLNFIRLNIFPLLAGIITKSAAVKRRIFPLISQTGIAYPNSKLTLESNVGKVHAGDRIPYFLFPDGKNIFDFLKKPIFKILFFGKNADNIKQPFEKPCLAMDFYSFNDIPPNVFGNHDGFYILLRPDNHISYIGNDTGKCLELINKIAMKTGSSDSSAKLKSQ